MSTITCSQPQASRPNKHTTFSGNLSPSQFDGGPCRGNNGIPNNHIQRTLFQWLNVIMHRNIGYDKLYNV